MPRKSILAIDDEDNVRSTLAAILLQTGYRVVAVKCISSAIESLVEDKFDLVLLDVKISDVEGLALLSNLHLVYPELPVLVMTAHPAMDIAELVQRFGASGYFLKPIDPVQLLDCIEKILSKPGQPLNKGIRTNSAVLF